MSSQCTVYAGTAGQGVWRSQDGGETFQRRCSGMFMEAIVRALAVAPSDPATLYAGTDAGIYRTTDGGGRWERLPAPFDPGNGWPAGVAVWSILVHPADQSLIFAGTCPAALYRSSDAGAAWARLDAAISPDCPPIVYSRVTCIRADPWRPEAIWAGVEIDGAWRSDDRGESWRRVSQGLSSMDIHDLAFLSRQPGGILASTNNDLNVSHDDGATWQPQRVKERFPFAYCRGLAVKADDPATILLGNGNGPPGTAGALQISRDGGATWRQAGLAPPPNSTVWTIATHAALPSLLFAATVNGYLYRSEDGGAIWRKCAHEFGELRALALVTA
ncbi:MAG TPA: hypothetical protein VKT77_15175 [Chthonomonadaceae bacterium]|nr:hypothetical protein [Chthonomonadaceae bacterium]